VLYLSQILGTPVEDQEHERVGRIIDILISAEHVGQSTPTYPSVLLLEGESDSLWRVPLEAIERQTDFLRLLVSLSQLAPQPAQATHQEIRVAQEVLDKQVIDIERKKAVRVNDVCFQDDWRILGVDNSTLGLVRRLTPSWLLGNKNRSPSLTIIPWEQIELIGSNQSEDQVQEASPQVGLPLAGRVTSRHLAELHPADIAEIVHHLTAAQGARVIERLDDEAAADAMEEIDTDRQLHILENIQSERAADILQAMGPDEAADLLADMPEERAQHLLRLMTPEESQDLQELLEYEEDSAGGLMTTDYIVLTQSKTVREALEVIRTNILEHDVRTAYVYCVADETQEEQHLLGVVSLWDLLVAASIQSLTDLMETDVVTVSADSDPHHVAQIMAKYNLLAVPVVNEDDILQGIITVDDALDVLLPPERRRRPTRMY